MDSEIKEYQCVRIAFGSFAGKVRPKHIVNGQLAFPCEGRFIPVYAGSEPNFDEISMEDISNGNLVHCLIVSGDVADFINRINTPIPTIANEVGDGVYVILVQGELPDIQLPDGKWMEFPSFDTHKNFTLFGKCLTEYFPNVSYIMRSGNVMFD